MDTTEKMLADLLRIVDAEVEFAERLAEVRDEKQRLMSRNMAELVGMGLVTIKLKPKAIWELRKRMEV